MPTSAADQLTPSQGSSRRRWAHHASAGWVIPALLGVVTLVGFAIRLSNLDQGFIADELSTYWIIHDRSLGKVVSLIHSDAEITPPVYFVLGWFTSKLGSDPMWIRLPSLLAGSASIPLIYMLGARTVGRAAGLIGAAVFALSPFMIYYAAEARAYSVMIFLLIVSTLALIYACETHRKRWWGLYAVCVCLAMLSHYTAIFYLIAQFLWAAWYHPGSRKGLLIASAASIVAFMPWITGFIADNNSPTTVILDALQPFNFQSVKYATEQWAIGYPYVPIRSAPGSVGAILILVAVVITGAGLACRAVVARKGRGGSRQAEGSSPPERAGGRLLGGISGLAGRIPAGLALVAALTLATPVGEAVTSAVSTNLYGARNLNAAWPGLALTAGAAVAAIGPVAGTAALLTLLAGLGIGASKTLSPDFGRTNYRDAAAFVEENSFPGEVILDGAALTPVPTTGLDVFLPPGHPEIRLDLPESDRPFAIGDPVPPPLDLTREAFRRGRKEGLIVISFLQTPVVRKGLPNDDPAHRRILHLVNNPPYGLRIAERKVFPGIPRIAVIIYKPSGNAERPAGSSGP